VSHLLFPWIIAENAAMMLGEQGCSYHLQMINHR